MNRAIEKKDNFFSIQLLEGEEVIISVGDNNGGKDELVFIVPEDMTLNGYMKRKASSITWKS